MKLNENNLLCIIVTSLTIFNQLCLYETLLRGPHTWFVMQLTQLPVFAGKLVSYIYIYVNGKYFGV